MNAGQKINLRLRPPGDTNNFYEYDQLVLVMLHEVCLGLPISNLTKLTCLQLTHNEHGPHSAQFYKLLAELEEEFYELKRKGYSGEGFHSAGNHLSGLKVDEYHGRAKGLAAAEKRLAVQRTIGKGGVLGGSSTRGRTMKEVLAEVSGAHQNQYSPEANMLSHLQRPQNGEYAMTRLAGLRMPVTRPTSRPRFARLLKPVWGSMSSI